MSGHPNTKKESILELTKMMDSVVRVKCLGGREIQGTLRGFDDLVNLVLDDSEEYLRGEYFCCDWTSRRYLAKLDARIHANGRLISGEFRA